MWPDRETGPITALICSRIRNARCYQTTPRKTNRDKSGWSPIQAAASAPYPAAAPKAAKTAYAANAGRRFPGAGLHCAFRVAVVVLQKDTGCIGSDLAHHPIMKGGDKWLLPLFVPRLLSPFIHHFYKEFVPQKWTNDSCSFRHSMKGGMIW